MPDPVADTPVDVQALMMRVAYLQPHGLLTFEIPADASEEVKRLALSIGLLDKRANRELGLGSEEWEGVVQLLTNAIALGVAGGELALGRENYQAADALLKYYKQLVPNNRINYLVGVGVGIIVVVVLGLIAMLLARYVDQGQPWYLMPMLCAFAALGSVASVLSRIASIEELNRASARATILIAGASRPVVPAIMSMAVYLVLALDIVTLAGIDSEDPNREKLYAVAAFLCGYSERFATEILERIHPSDDSA